MADFLQGLGGAGVGFLTGGPVGGVLGGLASMFGSQHQEDPIARQQRLFLTNIAQSLYNYGTGVPGSSPGELAALSSAEGNLGAQQRNVLQNIYSQYSPQQATRGNLADQAANLASRFTSQQMSLQQAQMEASLQARQNALLQAAQVAPRGGAQYMPNQLPQLLGQIAQSFAYQQGRSQGQGQQPAPYDSQSYANQFWQNGPQAGTQGLPGTGPGAVPASAYSGVDPGAIGPGAFDTIADRQGNIYVASTGEQLTSGAGVQTNFGGPSIPASPGSPGLPIGGGTPMGGWAGVPYSLPGAGPGPAARVASLPMPPSPPGVATQLPNWQTGEPTGPGIATQTQNALLGALPTPANMMGGANTRANQQRQSLGLWSAQPKLANPFGLHYG